MTAHDSIRAIQWQSDTLILLDQRCLPGEEIYLELTDVESIAAAISDMVVRGAPAIGITAAYGVVIAARKRYQAAPDTWQQDIESDLKLLAESRPTAVNLFWSINRMREVIASAVGNPVEELQQTAKCIHQEDLEANLNMGKLGARYIQPGSSVLTHCNTGSLATGGYGTALGVIRNAFSNNKLQQIYTNETHPWLQGSRLTAWELMRDNIPVTLLADGAAATLMQQGLVQWVIVGSDRITANGDVANKIGTYSLVTPAELVDVIVTERGVVEAPNAEKMATMMKNTA